MRLSDKIKDSIRKNFQTVFSANCEIFLFGSRINDNAKGGDIDLLIVCSNQRDKELSLAQRIDFLIKIKKEIGEQKIDVTICTQSELESDPFLVTISSSKIVI